MIQLTVIKCTLSISRVKVESVRSSLCRRHTHKYTYTYRTHRPFSQRESIVNFATPALQSHTHIHNVRTISLFLFISSDCNFLPNKKYPFHTALKDEDFVSFVKNNYNYWDHNFCLFVLLFTYCLNWLSTFFFHLINHKAIFWLVEDYLGSEVSDFQLCHKMKKHNS